MKINTKRNLIKFLLVYPILVLAMSLNLNRIVRTIIIFIGIMSSMLLVDYFVKEKNDIP